MPDLSARPQSVLPHRLDALLARLPGARLEGDGSVLVTGITHDSRAVQPGDLYVARAGARTHGIEHVTAAASAGAVAVLTDPPSVPAAQAAGLPAVVVDDVAAAMGAASAWAYGDPARELLLVGVTGTNGKTTTAYLVESGLRAAGHTTGLLGTIETRVGNSTVASVRTTPEATDLHALFAVMRESGVDAVAMEVSSHALALGRVDGIVFDVASFTNLSQDHLDFHGDMESYFGAKAVLFTPERAKRGVVCIDDEWGRRLAGQATVPVATTGVPVDADWRRVDDVEGRGGIGHTTVIDPDGARHQVTCRLLGAVNLSNAALAYVSLVRAGVDGPAALKGIGALAAVPGRMEPVDAGQDFLALVDYAHTPEAVAAALEAARGLAGTGRVIVVLGCGGDRDRAKRPQMGAAAATGADLAVFTNDNPRSEDPDAIIAAMVEGADDRGEIIVEPDRRRAIDRAVVNARAGDVVVIAGKGHEPGQEVAGVITPFDDRTALRDALLLHGAESR
ncbi:MAG TPA: UDP-N-acetylmuramoyl-L-alanyl-D-glutamate--2,6-diaminopimelate ligase [Mycobacteriales bacterium]|nr:UDP-N-acetylmuramoyl-L-alanyl-D-glutamate--2,6-diaminopimelate ligase [Mycobacteriales bacterium]